MDFTLRSFDVLGGQNAPLASDGVGLRVLYRCGACGRIWFQDGKRIALDLQEPQIQVLAQELNADLAHLPGATCRLCLYHLGGGSIEIDEYGKGAGFGFSWECSHPVLVHALLTIHSHNWLAKLSGPEGLLPDIVTQPEKMRAVLAWFVERLPPLPRQFHRLSREMCLLLNTANQPGFGQRRAETENWQWKGCRFEAVCPPLGGKVLLMLAVARPATEPFSLLQLYPVWQSLAFLTLLGSVAGEKRSGGSLPSLPSLPPHQ